ncbi:MAG: type II secretion system protein [Gammaproteobacteria bacterium]
MCTGHIAAPATLGGRRSMGASGRESGFTLVEIAIVLVIIGLLIGSILKGQEMINSARVRTLADTTMQTTAAYFGFVDRFRQVPGDWSAANATTAIGAVIATGGNEDGAIDHVVDTWSEPTGMWEQLSAAGFVQGAYIGAATEPTAGSNSAPENPFNGLVLVGRTPDYVDPVASPPPARRYVLVGKFVPVDLMQELDTKIDDGKPETGDLRVTTQAATIFAGTNNWGGYGAVACTATVSGAVVWDITSGPQDCNGVFFF